MAGWDKDLWAVIVAQIIRDLSGMGGGGTGGSEV